MKQFWPVSLTPCGDVVNQLLEEGLCQIKQHHTTKVALLLDLLMLITNGLPAYQVPKATINNGAHAVDQPVMKSPRFQVQASVGQTDANAGLQGDQYQLHGGFWQQNTDLIFKHSLD
jgi:hypothetical protein